jgi:mannitol-1-phosphate 5-dehydrogenase
MNIKKNAVIIGAGCTGRGFVARFLKNADYHITFLDKNENLIKKMQEKKSFTVFYGGNHGEDVIDGFEAFNFYEDTAIEKLAEAEVIFASVRTSNLADLGANLYKAFQQKKEKNAAAALKVVLCENGLDFHKILRDSVDKIGENNILITEAAIFCTTIAKENSTLDILSEEYFSMPYDTDIGGFTLDIPGIDGINNMGLLMQRKIFTYNCLSACIAYPGYYKGYNDYAEAGNDPEINTLCRIVQDELTPVLSAQFNISTEEQNKFSELAMKKFCNRLIADTIEKNARDVKRKLGEKERIFGPMMLIKEKAGNIKYLCLVAATAVYYGEKEEKLNINDIFMEEDISKTVKKYLKYLNEKYSITDIIREIKDDSI